MRPFALAAVAFAATLLAGTAQAQTVHFTGPAGQTADVTEASLAGLPRVSLTVTAHGQTHTYEGVMLQALLARVGAPSGEALRGPEMADVVLITCTDNYQVALALTDTDPTVRAERVILADRMDGAALPARNGPFQVVVEGDLKPARSARQVVSIEVRRLATGPAPAPMAPMAPMAPAAH